MPRVTPTLAWYIVRAVRVSREPGNVIWIELIDGQVDGIPPPAFI